MLAIWLDADKHMEEGQFDISFLPFEEVGIAILFIHSVLHNPPNDNVHS